MNYRKYAIISIIVLAVSLAILGLSFFLDQPEISYDQTGMPIFDLSKPVYVIASSWIALISLAIFIIFFALSIIKKKK